MGNEHVFDISRFSSHFTIKVESSRCKSSLSDHNLFRLIYILSTYEHGLCCFLHIHWELISVPAQKWISRVGIYRSQHSKSGSHLQIVFIVVSCKLQKMRSKPKLYRRVIGLDVQLEVFIQSVGLEKSDHSLSICNEVNRKFEWETER